MNHVFAGSMHKSKNGWVCYSYFAEYSKTKGPAYYREQLAGRKTWVERVKTNVLTAFGMTQ